MDARLCPTEEKCLLKILVIFDGSYVKLPLVGHLTEEKRLDFFFPRLIRSLIPAQVCFILCKLSEKNSSYENISFLTGVKY